MSALLRSLHYRAKSLFVPRSWFLVFNHPVLLHRKQSEGSLGGFITQLTKVTHRCKTMSIF
jgi:hypothetical protein